MISAANAGFCTSQSQFMSILYKVAMDSSLLWP